MKRVRINKGKTGVVTRNGDYKRVLTAGKHWIGMNQKVTLFDMSKVYTSDMDLNIMLRDEQFAQLVEILTIHDNEFALKYVADNFESVLTSGKYFYWKGLMDFRFEVFDLDEIEIPDRFDLGLIHRSSVGLFIRSFKVEAYEEGLLFIDGKFVRKLNKGSYHFWKNRLAVEVFKADLRQLQLEVSGQEILTRDKAGLRVNFFAQYKVSDAQKALLDNKDYEKQLYILIQLALREFIGSLNLDELLENKDAVAAYVMDILESKSSSLGVKVLYAGIRDIILPGEMKEIMNQVLVAQKRAQANIITRREETASTRSLLNTAKLMEDNSMLFKLKEMEYVEKIAEKIGEVNLSGGSQVIDQLKLIFSNK